METQATERSRIEQVFSQLAEKIREQEAYQQLKAKWDELDPTSRLSIKYASGISAVALALIALIASTVSLRSIKSDVSEKMDLINLVQSSNDELRQLRDAAAQAPGGHAESGPWKTYIEGQATSIGILRENLTVSEEKDGRATDQAKEAMIDVQLKKVNVKQLTRLAASLEMGSRPMKLRSLTVDTKNDPSGYVEASLALSGFSLKQ